MVCVSSQQSSKASQTHQETAQTLPATLLLYCTSCEKAEPLLNTLQHMQVVAWKHMAPKPCGFSAGLPPGLQTEHNCFPSACCLRISFSGAQLACQSSGQPKFKSLNGAPLACQSSGQPSYSCQRTGSRLLMGLLLGRFLRWSVQQQCTMSNAGMTCPHAVLSHKGVAMNPESKLLITDRFITILIGSPSSCGLQAQGAGLVPVWEGRPCAYALRCVTPQGEPHTQPIAAIVARLREPVPAILCVSPESHRKQNQLPIPGQLQFATPLAATTPVVSPVLPRTGASTPVTPALPSRIAS